MTFRVVLSAIYAMSIYPISCLNELLNRMKSNKSKNLTSEFGHGDSRD